MSRSERASVICIRVLVAVLGLSLAGAPLVRPAQAQSLEDSIDAELDSVGLNGGASSKSAGKEDPKKKASSAAPKPESGLKSSGPDEDLELELGEDDEDLVAEELGDPQPKPVAKDKSATAPAPAAKPSQKPATTPESDSFDEPIAEESQPADKPEPPPAQVSEPADLPSFDEPPLDADAEPAKPTVVDKPRSPEPSSSDGGFDGGMGAGIGDTPNTDLEARLFRIYKDWKPISDDRWSEIIGARQAEVYLVQAGDTLWDISQTFFGDGFFWSKLWAQNETIENPHKISVGRTVKFIAGDESEAPTIGVADRITGDSKQDEVLVASNELSPIRLNTLPEHTGEKPQYREDVEKTITRKELEAGTVIEEAEIIPRPDIPAPKVQTKPPTKLPNSFRRPGGRRADAQDNFDITGLEVVKSNALTKTATIIPNALIFDSRPREIGVVDEIEASDVTASLGQNVFVKLKRPASVGERLSIFDVRKSLKSERTSTIGILAEVSGQVEIVGVADEKNNVYLATVLMSVNPIPKGGMVLDEPLPQGDYSRTGRRSEVKVRVVGGEFDETRKIIAESSVIFLDGGSKAGLQVGDLLGVQANRGVRHGSSKYGNVTKPIALIKIIDVRETVATALVLETSEEIMPGDKTSGEFPIKPRDLKSEGFGDAPARAQAPGQSAEGGDLELE